MSDPQTQNAPTLSLEEELDVLESVYRIGKEKGLDLLRPEQMKKLEDAGRSLSSQTKHLSVDRPKKHSFGTHLIAGLMSEPLFASSNSPLWNEVLFKQKYGCYPGTFLNELFFRENNG